LTTFGQKAAIQFYENIDRIIYDLGFEYFMYPECRFLKTTNKIYRNIILESYLIIYRVTKTRIELLRIFHSSVCTTNRIKPIRGMRLRP